MNRSVLCGRKAIIEAKQRNKEAKIRRNKARIENRVNLGDCLEEEREKERFDQ